MVVMCSELGLGTMGYAVNMMKAAAVAVVALLSPMTAEAVSIALSTDGVTYTTVYSDSGFDNAASSGIFGGMYYNVSGTSADLSGSSVLNTVAVSITSQRYHGGSLYVAVSEDNYTGGVGAANLGFSMAATSLSGGLTGSSFVGSGLFDTSNQIGSDIAFVGDGVGSFSDFYGEAANLNQPFSMSQFFKIDHTGGSGLTSFTATTIAAVPLPAGALLLLTGLGGFSLLRRRAKKAA